MAKEIDMSAYVTNLGVKRIWSLAVQRMCSRKYYILLVVPKEENVSISTDYFLFTTKLKIHFSTTKNSFSSTFALLLDSKISVLTDEKLNDSSS